MIGYHTVAARDLRTGDRLDTAGVESLRSWCDSVDDPDPGASIIVASVDVDNDRAEIVFADGDAIETLTDVRVIVARPLIDRAHER